MLRIPINQSVAGDGNTDVQGIYLKAIKSLHMVYMNANGTLYTGNNTAVIKIYASNEELTSWSNSIAPVHLATIQLNKDTPAELYDVIGTYKNMKVTVDAIIDGKITTHYQEG